MKTMKTISLATAVLATGLSAHDVVSADTVDTALVTENQPVVVSEEALKTATSERDAAKEEVANLETEVSEFDKALAELEASTKEAEKTLAEVDTYDMDAVKRDYDEVVASLPEMENNLPALEEALVETEADLGEAKTAHEDAQKEQANLNALVDTLKEDIAKQEAALENLNPTNLDAQIADVTNQVTAKETEVATLDQAIRDKEAEVSATETVKNVHRTSGDHSTQDDRDRHGKHFNQEGFPYEAVEKAGNDLVVKEIEISPEELANYRLDSRKLTEAFHNHIKELFRLNNLDFEPFHISDEAIAYATARAEEMRRNDKMSHNTNIADPTGFARSGENIGWKIGQAFANKTEDQVAYDLAFAWFSEYNNSHGNYGHRSALFRFGLGGVGVSQASDTGKIYYSFDLLSDTKDPNFRRQGGKRPRVTADVVGDKLYPYLAPYGKFADELTPDEKQEMVFLPATSYHYYNTVTKTSDASRQAELDDLRRQKEVAEAEKDTIVARLATLEATRLGLESRRKEVTTDLLAKEAELAKAFNQKTTLDRLVSSLTLQVETATEARDAAQTALLDQKKAISEAKEAKENLAILLNGKRAITEALEKLTEERNQVIADKTATLNDLRQAKEVLAEKEQALKDLNLRHVLSQTYRVKENATGLLATPKDVPTVVVKPVYTLEVKVPNDAPTTDNKPNAVMDVFVPKTYPTVQLPEYTKPMTDVKGVEVQSPKGVEVVESKDDTKTELVPDKEVATVATNVKSAKAKTGKTLPKTGDVTSTVAVLSGFASLMAALPLKKRR